MIDDKLVQAHRARALSPDRPFIRGTAQNPDAFFQARETANPYYNACPAIVQKAMDKFAEVVGRKYHLFDYVGDSEMPNVWSSSWALALRQPAKPLFICKPRVKKSALSKCTCTAPSPSNIL